MREEEHVFISLFFIRALLDPIFQGAQGRKGSVRVPAEHRQILSPPLFFLVWNDNASTNRGLKLRVYLFCSF